MPQEKAKPSTSKKKRSTRPLVSAVLSDGTLVETLYDKKRGRTNFAVSKNQSTDVRKDFVKTGVRYVPFSPHNSLLKHGVVLFPSEVSSYESEDDLVSEIRAFIHRYVDVGEVFEYIASYYVLLTWVYDSFNELPYLRLKGDAGSGKTRFLLTVGSLCYKPIFASGASTVSPIFRMIDSVRGTLLIDEGDFRFSDEHAEIVKILNNGNARGFPVLRSEASPTGEYSPRAYSIFGPKLIATRRSFDDHALESRCITEEMGGHSLREDVPITLPPAHKDEARSIRNKLLSFRFRNFGRYVATDELLSRDIEPRLRQVFTPLLSIVGGRVIQEKLTSLVEGYQGQYVTDRGMSAEAQVLEVIRDLVSLKDGQLSIKEIATWFSDRFGEEYEKRITAKWIGGVVRNQLQIRTQKSHGVFVIPPGEFSKLEWLFKRYGLRSDEEGL